VIGLLFIIWRVALALYLAGRSVSAAHRGNYLPLLMFCACGMPLVSGQFSQPTELGFAVFGSGLCVAALREEEEEEEEESIEEKPEEETEPLRVRGRGRHAEALHQ
jgi:hypothetical protein